MCKLKASAFENLKKPSSLYELQSRLCSFQYQSQFLPGLKDILYPLHFLIRNKKFQWGQIEENAWQMAKKLTTLNITLVVPDPSDELVLFTDASKVAASAALFKVQDKKLRLVSVSSKYFNSFDLNKNSYMLESLSLAYALKIFSAYLLNCESQIKIFTDAKSLIFTKRMASHSILCNNVLSYLTNFVSLANVSLYHIPGQLNVLADILSRAIQDNLNCHLPRQHPISKQWAKVLPPIPSRFGVSHEALFKFLTTPPQPEARDIYDRSHRKLMEPRTLQSVYDESSTLTPEDKFYNAVTMLEGWNSDYAKKYGKTPPHLNHIQSKKLLFDVQKSEALLQEIRNIVAKIYPEIDSKRDIKKIEKILLETARKFLYIPINPTEEIVKTITSYASEAKNIIKNYYSISKLYQKQNNNLETAFLYALQLAEAVPEVTDPEHPKVFFKLSENAVYLPKICNASNGIDRQGG
jgi:hypothetical protein